MINLEQDFIKFEKIGDDSYYGYVNPGTDGSSKSWSIRKVSGTSSVDVSWNLNSKFVYTAIWDNKDDHFQFDGSASVTATWSISESTNSFGVTRSVIDIDWTDIPGVDIYKLRISDSDGIIYNNLHVEAINPYVIEKFTTTTKDDKYRFIGFPNMTYSVNFTNVNQTGENPDPGNPYIITT